MRQFDTPTICNVVELFDIRPRTVGYMDKRIVACYPKLPPMVGYASTATFRRRRCPLSGNVLMPAWTKQVASFADLPGPAVVVFQDVDCPVVAATFGEVMCTTYKAFGAAGLITSGAARDIDQVEALHFPCFSDGVICAHGHCHIPQINVPVHVGNVMVHPGDLVHGDRNGVTIIPNHLASATAQGPARSWRPPGKPSSWITSSPVKIDPKGYAAARKESKKPHRRHMARKLKALL